MPKIEGWIFDTLRGLFVLASWTQEFAIAAAHQSEAALHEADGTIAQIMRLPGALRDTLLAKEAFGDRAIALVFIAPVQCAQDQRKPLAPLRRKVGRRSDPENGRSAYARANGQPGRGAQTTSPLATLSLATRRLQAVPSSTSDGWRHRTAARHASRPCSAATRRATVLLDPERSVELTFATTKRSPTKRSAELLAPKIRSARGRPFAGQPRKDRPHFFRNSAGAPSSGFSSAR